MGALLEAIVGPDGPARRPETWQLCVRAAIVLLIGILYIRIAGRRTFARASALDIVVALVLGSNLSRTMTGNSPFVPTLIASLALALLHRMLAALTLRFAWLDRLLKGRPLVLVQDGAVDERAMRRVRVTRGDLDEAVRAHGLERLDQVHLAVFEDGGAISIIAGPPRT